MTDTSTEPTGDSSHSQQSSGICCGPCTVHPGKIFQKVKDVLLRPKEVWSEIYAEDLTIKQILLDYYLPVVLLASICTFIGAVVIGTTVPFVGTLRASFFPSIIHLIAQVGMSALFIWLGSKIVSFLATKFSAEMSETDAAKALAFSFLPLALGGVLSIIPMLSILNFFLALYTLYILYCAFASHPSIAADRKVGFYITSIVVLLISFMIIGVVVFSILPAQYDVRETAAVLKDRFTNTLKDFDQDKAQEFMQKMKAIKEASDK